MKTNFTFFLITQELKTHIRFAGTFLILLMCCAAAFAQTTISSFTPTSGVTGTTVTITGTNFTGATAVSFGGVAASSFNVVSSTSITAVVGAGATGLVSVKAASTAFKSLFTFTFPTITSFTPTSATAGTTVTINGTRFTGATAVKFGGIPASSFIIVSASQITAVADTGYTGNIAVTTPEGTATRTGYKGIPTITSFTPASGPVGTTVTITGANFDTIPANNFVYFGDVRAIVSAARMTSLTVTVPTGATFEPIRVTASTLTAQSSKPFLVNFPGGGQIYPASYITALQSPSLGGNSTVTTGDLDGDGKPDLVLAHDDGTASALSVFRNTSSAGSYSFDTLASYLTDYSARDTWLADLDGDGKLDMIGTDVASGFMIFRNTSTLGNISFAARITLPAGVNPSGMSTADFDGDGKIDLAVGNILDNMITVFRNTGSVGVISFGPAITLPAGLVPATLSSADIDGDGKVDLIVTDANENYVSVFLNTGTAGNISFALKVDLPGGLAPYGLAVGDLDGDGKVDIVVTNINEDSMAIYKNQSTSGTVSFASRITMGGNVGDYTICLSDMDGDGKLDIVSLGGQNQLAIFKNNSTAGSIAIAEQVSFYTGAEPRSFNIADVNGDGKYDIIISDYPQLFTVLKNNVLEAIAMSPLKVDVKLLLQGPLSGSSMANYLNSAGVLAGYALTQPYNTSALGYRGTESVNAAFFTAHSNIVDWVLIELRDKADFSSVISRQAAFITASGKLMDTGGNSSVYFQGMNSDSFFISLRFRNHLAVVSSNAVSLTGTTPAYDFTTALTQAMDNGNSDQLKQVAGLWVLWSGDVNGDHSIDAMDLNITKGQYLQGYIDEYRAADVNMDGTVDALDLTLIKQAFLLSLISPLF